MKRFLSCIREYKIATILSPLFVALEVVVECFIPLVTAHLIDYMKSGNEIKVIIYYGLALIAMSMLSLAFGVLSGKYCAKASAGFAKNLRKDLFYQVQQFSFENIDRFSSSSLVTRLTTDVSNVQMSFMMIIRIAVRAPFMFLFSFAMTISINFNLALVLICSVPFLALIFFIIIKIAMPHFEKVFKKYDNLNNSVQENIKGIRVVKSYVREDYEIEKFNKRAQDIKKDFTIAEKIVALNSPAMNFFIFLAMTLISLVGSKLIINTFGGIDDSGNYLWGELSTGELSSFLTYTMQILSSLMMISMIFVMVTISNASGKRIIEVLKEESTIKNPENPIMEVKNGNVTFNHVSFKYQKTAEKNALSDINLEFKSGETIGIIGGTGSSKTTLINLISRLYDCSEGTITVGDIDVKDYDLDTLRNSVSVVLQKNVLFSGTILENLRWGDMNATLDEVKHACNLACASEFIEQMPDKYETHIEQGGTNVSGGQKQRLCIARALLKKPKILILDDSTSAVDTKTDALIRKSFKTEIPNTTKIIIAQRIASVMESDKILILDKGEVNAFGTHQELLETNEIYKEIYYSQNKEERKEA